MRIVLGIGGTPDAMQALERTVQRTTETGDRLTIAILENPDADRSAAEIEAAVANVLDEHDASAEVVQLAGEPGPALTDFAAEGAFDRIVLGGGHRSPMGKIAVGRVAEFVIMNADRTVTLIR